MDPKRLKKGWFYEKNGGSGDSENSKDPPELQVAIDAPLFFQLFKISHTVSGCKDKKRDARAPLYSLG
jgi:hypothetical protein